MRRTRTQFCRFRDLSPSHINRELHIHTHRTDGNADITSIVQCAIQRGLQQIAFTEHVREGTNWFHDFASEVRAAADVAPEIEILVGCETKALNVGGSLDVSEEILAECDIVLGSVHRFPNGGGGTRDSSMLTRSEFSQIEFELSIGLLDSDDIDVLAHPGSMFVRRFGDPFPENLMRHLLAKSLEKNIAIEINSSHQPDLHGFLTLCAEMNPYVSIGSDVHSINHIGHCRDLLMKERKSAQ